MPQNWHETERTADEWDTFNRGLSAMVAFYASLTATCVLQQRVVPPRPAAYDGHVALLSASDEDLAHVQNANRAGVLSAVLVASYSPGLREAHVHYESAADASAFIEAAQARGRSVVPVYNDRPYDNTNDKGNDANGRGCAHLPC